MGAGARASIVHLCHAMDRASARSPNA
jgi:hypothetical protein